ncbi:hypothetical protein [Streptomyces sp. NPDC051132]|uniref:hypothetical protein n=1 Tax=unclassified Streptomyces TaxID=2593676 RepID=UPI003436F88C
MRRSCRVGSARRKRVRRPPPRRGPLLTCTGEFTTYSTAAKRFLEAEAKSYGEARRAFEHSVAVFLLARDLRTGEGDYLSTTNTLN